MPVTDQEAVPEFVQKAIAAEVVNGEACVWMLKRACLMRAEGPFRNQDRPSFKSLLVACYYRPDMRTMDSKTWATALQLELDEALHAVLLCDSLFEEPIVCLSLSFKACWYMTQPLIRMRSTRYSNFWVLLFEGLVIEQGQMPELEAQVRQRTAARMDIISSFFWNNRQRLSALWAPDLQPDRSGHSSPLLGLISAYLHITIRENGDSPVALMKIFLFLWVSFSDQQHPSMADLAFHSHNTTLLSWDRKKLTEYVEDVILGVIGPDAFFARVLQDLQLEQMYGKYLRALLRHLDMPGLHPLLVPAFVQNRCLETLAATMEKYSTDEDESLRLVACKSAPPIVQ